MPGGREGCAALAAQRSCCSTVRNGRTGEAACGKWSVLGRDVQGWRAAGGPLALLLHPLGCLGGGHSGT